MVLKLSPKQYANDFFLQLALEIREKLNVFTLPPSNSTQQLENEERYCDGPKKGEKPVKHRGTNAFLAKSGSF